MKRLNLKKYVKEKKAEKREVIAVNKLEEEEKRELKNPKNE
jgi:hypothetical protein